MCIIIIIIIKGEILPPKPTFSQYHILAPRGFCTLKLLQALENDQGLLAHTQLGKGVLNRFSQMWSKFVLKLSECTFIIFG